MNDAASTWTGLQRLLQAHGLPAGVALLVLMVVLPLWPEPAPLAAVAAFGLLAVHHRGARIAPILLDLRRPWPWMMALYLYHGIGMLWTDDLGFGAFDLQIKLPLLLLPLLAAWSAHRTEEHLPVLMRVFAWANAAAVIICSVAAAWRVLALHGEPAQEVFSSRWSLFLHPSYFAMYLTVALCAWCLLPRPAEGPRWAFSAVLALLVLGVVLCGSKMGWGILVVVLPVLLVIRRGDPVVRRSLAAMGALFILGVGGLVAFSPYARERMLEMVQATQAQVPDPTSATSSSVRRLTWGTAWDLFTAAPLLGTGTGDIKNELVAAYQRSGYTGAADHRLNAHDQFLQTAACLGIGGALLILGMVLVPLSARSPHRALAALFLLITAANWTVESMLEVQAGALFFSVMACLMPWTAVEGRTSPASAP
ncbi:MAG: O-antigen ligase family protein [Flavobacteriales bacterium]